MRCEICKGCGRCFTPLDSPIETDTSSGATNWADAFKALDKGTAAPPPPIPGAPGQPTQPGATSTEPTAGNSVAIDGATGATPGVASACADLGLNDLATVCRTRAIKPPGVS